MTYHVRGPWWCRFGFVQLRYTCSRNDVGSPKSTLVIRTLQVGLMFCFLPTTFISSTYTETSPSRLTNKHSQFGTLPNHILKKKKLSLITFLTKVLPKDDRTDFIQEEQPDLPYWTMIRAICALVDVSQYLDILTSEFCTMMVHHPFWLGCKRILRLLLVLRILVVLKQYPLLLQPSFVMPMILAQWTLHTILNHLSQCHLGIQLDLYIVETVAPTPNSWDDRDPSMTQNELFYPYSLPPRSLLSCFWLVSCHAGIVSIFPLLFPLPSGVFNAWGIGLNLCTTL